MHMLRMLRRTPRTPPNRRLLCESSIPSSCERLRSRSVGSTPYLAREIQTPYWPLTGTTSSTDLEARPRAYLSACCVLTFVQLDLIVMPLLTLIYLASSLDKSNLGNAKSLGMMKDIGNDPTGDTYALLNSLYYVSYAPFSPYLPKPTPKRPS